MSILVKVLTSVVLVLLLSGCTKSFLETFPTGPYTNHAESDTRHTWQCVVLVKGVLLRTDPLNFKGARYVVESYDRDGDARPDFALVYGYVGNGGQLSPFPDRYIVKEPDGVYEFVDINGDGRCRSIRAAVGNPDQSEPGSPAQPKEPMGEGDCHDTPPDPKEQA